MTDPMSAPAPSAATAYRRTSRFLFTAAAVLLAAGAAGVAHACPGPHEGRHAPGQGAAPGGAPGQQSAPYSPGQSPADGGQLGAQPVLPYGATGG
ncbi:hypothetical protein [Streptomyces sp. ODS28]|uniref:hypothetical protein n=1 Tax=Streptomyces sp. ODS28 TaxID=3136688 RepID=UPI0031E5D328